MVQNKRLGYCWIISEVKIRRIGYIRVSVEISVTFIKTLMYQFITDKLFHLSIIKMNASIGSTKSSPIRKMWPQKLHLLEYTRSDWISVLHEQNIIGGNGIIFCCIIIVSILYTRIVKSNTSIHYQSSYNVLKALNIFNMVKLRIKLMSCVNLKCDIALY